MTVPMGNNSAKKYSYYYDKEGRQVGMDVEAVSVTSNHTLTAGSSGSNTRFFYDNSKNRVKLITKSGDVYYFVYDPTASIPAVVYEAAGNAAYLNTREPSGALIGREKYVSGVYQYGRTYHFDGLGSTIALTDEDGVTTDTYSYDAWGNVTPGVNNQTTDNPYQYVGKYGYYTHWQEPTLNLLQLGVRYYDPSVGRFTQLDPIRDGLNWYGYVDGNPISNVDPFGLSSSFGHCVRLRLEIYNMTNRLRDELNRYVPIEDAKGGHFWCHGGASGETTKYGHFIQIKQLQQGINNRLYKYYHDCKGDDYQKIGRIVTDTLAEAKSVSIPDGFCSKWDNWSIDEQGMRMFPVDDNGDVLENVPCHNTTGSLTFPCPSPGPPTVNDYLQNQTILIPPVSGGLRVPVIPKYPVPAIPKLVPVPG